MSRHDHDINVKSKEEIDLLMAINSQQLEILRELQVLAAAGNIRIDAAAGKISDRS